MNSLISWAFIYFCIFGILSIYTQRIFIEKLLRDKGNPFQIVKISKIRPGIFNLVYQSQNYTKIFAKRIVNFMNILR